MEASKGKRSRRGFLRNAAIGVSGLVIGGLAGSLLSQATTPPATNIVSTVTIGPWPPKSLVEAAEKEGSVAMYSTTSADLLQGLMNAFMEDYRSIKAQAIRFSGGGAELTTRVMAEHSAGRETVDIVGSAIGSQFVSLITQQDLIEQYVSPVYADVPPQYIAYDNRLVALNGYGEALAYNTNLVTSSEAPKDRADLTDPKWKGRIAIPDPKVPGGNFAGVYLAIKLLGWEWFEGLAKNKPLLFPSNAPVVQSIQSAQTAVGLVGDAFVNAERAKGAPLAYNYPRSGVRDETQMMGIYKYAPHPNAARLLIGWLLSEKAQKAMTTYGTPWHSIRKGLSNGPPPNVIPVNFQDLLAVQDDWIKKIAEILSKY